MINQNYNASLLSCLLRLVNVMSHAQKHDAFTKERPHYYGPVTVAC